MLWAKHKRALRQGGFTIVELLIVIVVIAILAAIIIVAYNGMQAKANYSKAQQDLKSIVKALDLYYIDHQRYPISVNQDGCTYHWCGWDQAGGDDFITGLAPEYISQIPQMPESNASNDTYLYRSNADGSAYQLIRYKADGLPGIETQDNPLLATTDGYDENGGMAWGYRTNTDGHWW